MINATNNTPVNIQTYSLAHVLANDRKLFNTNNIWPDGVAPSDYRETLEKTHTHAWVDRFHSTYHTLVLGSHDLRWMKQAFAIGTITKRVPHMFDDELKETCKKHAQQMNHINSHLKENERGWFVRTEYVSLKHGLHGIVPYNSLRDILESMITCRIGHGAFREDNTCCKIYFLQFLDLDYDKEFRVFVYNNRITAVSAQHLYSVNKWLAAQTDTQIQELVQRLVQSFNNHIAPRMLDFKCYVMDLALVGDFENGDEKFYFIEPNSFGAEYASGSALYHWQIDHYCLHSNVPIDFRYVVRS